MGGGGGDMPVVEKSKARGQFARQLSAGLQ